MGLQISRSVYTEAKIFGVLRRQYAVANVVGYIKGKSAIQIVRTFGGRRRNFTGENFWARGYFVSTVGLEENMAERISTTKREERYEQMKLGM